jgi:hypothetical protein
LVGFDEKIQRKFRNVLLVKWLFAVISSPDRSGKPGAKKTNFS